MAKRESVKGSTGKLSKIFTTMLLIVIALSLTGTIWWTCETSCGRGAATTGYANLTGAAATLVSLVPLFWVIMVLGIGVSAIYIFLRRE